MKMQLTLTGSSAALAAAMAAFEQIEGNPASSTSTGTGTPAPTPIPSAPTSAAPTPLAPTASNGTDADDDDEGDVTDGSGVDSTGLPWDERIHSSSKKRGKDGTWNKRRGGPSGDALAAIEQELRGAQGSTPAIAGQGEVAPLAPQPLAPVPPMPATASEAPQPAPLAPVPPMPAAASEAPAPVAQPMPGAVPQPAPVPMPAPVVEQPAEIAAATAAPVEWDFASFMQAVGPKMGEGANQINAGYLAQVCQHYGLASITDLAMKPEMIAQIIAQFTADNRW